MRITHHGHSCLLVEHGDTRVLIDPGTMSDFASLTDLDAVLVTHQHADHLDPARIGGLLAANPEAVLRTDPGTAQQLADLEGAQGLGEPQINVAGEAFTIGEIEISPVGDQHAVIHRWLPRIENIGLVLRAGGTSLFHPGDALDADPGEVDHLAVPVSAPWCAVKETIDFVRAVAPRVQILPIHDALLKDGPRGMYLKHIADFGLEGGVPVLDIADGVPHELRAGASIA
ncbi:MBL fold metallo-hydrolase [Dermacoccaceae bacterium W4C1]